MGEMLTLQVTIFSVMAIGFLLKKIKLISARGQKEITDLVINLILPANIITSFMTEISTDTISDCAWIAVISIGIQLIALFYGNLFFHKENENRPGVVGRFFFARLVLALVAFAWSPLSV